MLVTVPNAVFATVLALALLFGCDFLDRGCQQKTYTRMQGLVSEIETQRKPLGRMPTWGELHDRQPMWLQDAWGRQITYEIFEAEGIIHYYVISGGANGRFELDDPRDYRLEEPRDVAFDVDKDIVAIDGEFIQFSGK